jgi:hypothetical protein
MHKPFVYVWIHLSTQRWYIGSRTAKGCHPDDGYITSSKIVNKLLTIDTRSEWVRIILFMGDVNEVLELETRILRILDAKNDTNSFNKHNNDGISVWVGDKNPMKDPDVVKRQKSVTSGKNHWTAKLGDKEHPQKGQKRPTISGINHPNKKPENAAKISLALSGIPKPNIRGENNPMHNEVNRRKVSKALTGRERTSSHSNNISRAKIGTKQQKVPCKFCSNLFGISNVTKHEQVCVMNIDIDDTRSVSHNSIRVHTPKGWFSSIAIAARALGIDPRTIKSRVKSQNVDNKDYYYEKQI